MKRLLALTALGMTSAMAPNVAPASAQLSIGISVNFAPPAIPVYDQPPIPAPDYMWIPGYWAWDDDVQDYYWIPGTWVPAPRPGLLWTPPWWDWQDGVYLFHPGYWGAHVGFYGGVAYGFGYTGSGYEGAYWNGPHLFYNRSVTNITNIRVTNVYNKTVIVNRTPAVSYRGGPGGVQAQPSQAEQAAMREARVPPTPVQQQHLQAARSNRQLFTSANRGRPPIAAAARPGQFAGPDVVPAKQAPDYHAPPAARPADTDPRRNPSAPHPVVGHADQPPLRDGAHGGPSPQKPAPDDHKMIEPWRRPNNMNGGPGPQAHEETAPRSPAESHPPVMRPASPPHRPPPPPRPPHPQGGGHPHDAGHPKPPPPHKEDHPHN